MSYTIDLTQLLQASLTKIYKEDVTAPMVCVEIGSFEGRGSRVIYEKLCRHADSKLYCIDPLEDFYVKDSDPRLNFWDSACVGQKGRFMQNTKSLTNLIMLEGTSDKMLPKICEPVDFVYIDGDHSPIQVYKDAIGMFNKMKDGGVILFDDYKFKTNGVITAEGIDRFLSEIKGQYILLLKDYQLAIQVMRSTDELSTIAFKYGSDKCPAIGHRYTPEYHRLLEPMRASARLVLEIGIGNAPLMVPLVGSHYKPGASQRMWRDYFPNARIGGCDILRNVLFSEDRIQTFYADQSDAASLTSLVVNDIRATQIDLIIDDGSHKKEHQIISFKTLWPYVCHDGFYIIEDVTSNNIEEIRQLAANVSDALVVHVHCSGKWWGNFVAFKKVTRQNTPVTPL